MFSYAAKVDMGVYEHQNDDRLLIASHILTNGELSGRTDAPYMIASVCDGVGGLAQGYRAAMITLEVMSHFDRQGVSSSEIKEAIEVSNRRIRNVQSIESLLNGLRTTIAGIYADGDRFYVYNAGDSRVYRFRYQYLNQLSKDHSFVQDLIDLGEISVEEARTHKQKNIINKCIGNDERVNPRVVDMSDDLIKDDIILICSDGITDVVMDTELNEIMLQHKKDADLLECCNRICEKAVENGSKDNMSVILLRKEEGASE